MKKYTKEEINKMDAIDIYKLVLEQKHIKKFPHGFWQQPEALENAVKCIKYLIEDLLCLSDTELKKQLSRKLFQDNGLGGMLITCFNNVALKAIELAYPDKFHPWEFKVTNRNCWKDTNRCVEAIRWLIETKLQLTDDELKEQLSIKFFNDNGLGGMLETRFNNSAIKAINTAYPGKFKEEDFKNYVFYSK